MAGSDLTKNTPCLYSWETYFLSSNHVCFFTFQKQNVDMSIAAAAVFYTLHYGREPTTLLLAYWDMGQILADRHTAIPRRCTMQLGMDMASSLRV